MAFPVSFPPYQAWIMPFTDAAQGISTGVPDCITTTVDGFAAATAEMSAFVEPGRSMFSRSVPSLSQSACRNVSLENGLIEKVALRSVQYR